MRNRTLVTFIYKQSLNQLSQSLILVTFDYSSPSKKGFVKNQIKCQKMSSPAEPNFAKISIAQFANQLQFFSRNFPIFGWIKNKLIPKNKIQIYQYHRTNLDGLEQFLEPGRWDGNRVRLVPLKYLERLIRQNNYLIWLTHIIWN